MAKALSTNASAIGMTTMVPVQQSQGRISSISLNNKKPKVKNIKLDNYQLTRDLYLIMQSKPSQLVTSFLAFLQSVDGKQIIIKNNASTESANAALEASRN